MQNKNNAKQKQYTAKPMRRNSKETLHFVCQGTLLLDAKEPQSQGPVPRNPDFRSIFQNISAILCKNKLEPL